MNRKITILFAAPEEQDGGRGIILKAEERCKEKGYTVITAGSGSECIRLAKENQPDLVVAHDSLMDLNGETLITGLREYAPPDKTLILLIGEPGISRKRRLEVEQLSEMVIYSTAADSEELVEVIDVIIPSVRSRRIMLENEARFRMFYKESPVPYQALDEKGNIAEVNGAWLEVLGYIRDDVIGRYFGDFLTSESREKFTVDYKKFRAAGRVDNVHFDILRADGSIRTILFTGRAGHFGEDGSMCIYCVFSDITEQKLGLKKIKRLNTILKAISVINRYLIREKDEQTLIKVICSHLTSARSYDSAWIVLFDKSGKVRLYAESGLDDVFSELIGKIKSKPQVPCLKKALRGNGVVVVTEPEKNCSICPLVNKHQKNAGLTAKLAMGGKTYGILTVSMPPEYLSYEEEIHLFEGVANDTAFILHGMEQERKREDAEKSLKESEAFNRSIVESSKDCIELFDTEGRIQFISENGCKLMEIEDVNLYIGTDWRTLWKGRDYKLAVEAAAKASRGEAGEFTGCRATEKGTPKWWNVIITPVYDKNGNIQRFLSVLRDITEKREIQEQYDRLYNAVEQSPVGVLMLDSKFRVVYVNPWFEKLSGYRREEITGKRLAFLSSGYHSPEFFKTYWETVAQGQVWRGEIKNKKKNGELYWVAVTTLPLKNGENEITGYIEYEFDITERKKLEEQFLQAQKLETVGRLAGGVAHDFNNMLTVINGYAEVALAGLKPEDKYYNYFKQIQDAGRRSENIARQLLAFSRKQILNPRVLNINEVISGLQKILFKLLGEDIRLIVGLDDNAGLVKVDVGQLEQVLMNLCINARDAMPAGGTLTLETKNVYLDDEYLKMHHGAKPGKYVMLAVTDTGIGMDRETLGKIFEPFFTTKPMGVGTGLGLSTVYGIIKQSGGNIWAYSEPGKGTTFKVYLPQMDVKKDSDGLEIADDNKLLKGTEKILVVEDDAFVREITTEGLKDYGYTVFPASGGEEAAGIAGKNKDIDLIISDVVMPGMDGRQVVAVLLEYCPNAGVLYMSGYTSNVIAHHNILDRGINFIEKPFTPRMLARRVREILDKKVK